jgi:hypothetical protein
MESERSVLVREPCPDCDGRGSRGVEKSAGHVSWSKAVDCASCQGKGHISRWVELDEFQRLLDRASSTEPERAGPG